LELSVNRKLNHGLWCHSLSKPGDKGGSVVTQAI